MVKRYIYICVCVCLCVCVSVCDFLDSVYKIRMVDNDFEICICFIDDSAGVHLYCR